MTTRTDIVPGTPGTDPFATAYPQLGAFWQAAEEGRFLLRSCTRCDRAHWYPRMLCPFCHGRELDWKASTGAGVVHSYSVMRRVEVPYALAYVELAEKVVLMTNIVDCDVDDVHIGQAVKLVFRRTAEGRLAPYFTPS
jgi:uncharacterized OB-fold protein